MNPSIEFISAVLVLSPNPAKLAAFYVDVLGIPLKQEMHGETKAHYGCELGDVHFAIHPSSNFGESGELKPGTIRLAFVVFDIQRFCEKLAHHKIDLLYSPQDAGFAIMTAIRDPDGNYLEFTQLADSWYKHLESCRNGGQDVVTRWRNSKAS